MSVTYLPAALRKRVRQRAQFRGEYCRLKETDAFLPHEADHVIAEKHGGLSIFENLACSCFDCNRFKGSDIASIDPISGKIVPLYNPRTQAWNRHFKISGGEIMGFTAAGRATVKLLKLNLPARVEVRQMLFLKKHWPE
ncbi:MAG TPA: HNH endonuclease [Blastocatellia bacterium]|nr:HNH endonuclease [Blastocatellia bacterium]